MRKTAADEAPLARSPEETARLAGCGRTAIFAAIRDGELTAHKIGRRTVILDADLRAWLSRLPTREPSRKAA